MIAYHDMDTMAAWHHATERLDHWQGALTKLPTHLKALSPIMHDINMWQRQRMILWGRMTNAQRDSLYVR